MRKETTAGKAREQKGARKNDGQGKKCEQEKRDANRNAGWYRSVHVRPAEFGAACASFRDRHHLETDGCKLSETMGASCRMLQQWPQRQQCPHAIAQPKIHRTQEG